MPAHDERGRRAHRIGSARLWSLLLVAGAAAVSIQQMTQPDYNAHRKAPPSEYLPVVLPGLALVAVIAWRIWRCRVETSTTGMRVIRTTTTDDLPWAQVAGFEVKRTPNRGGWRLVARHIDERVTVLANTPGKGEKARARVEALRAALEDDRDAFGGVSSRGDSTAWPTPGAAASTGTR